MTRFQTTLFLTTLFAILFLSLPLRAQEQDIQTVITDQISAFRSDDFETAFTYAAPNIHRMFKTPDRFGQMVRDGYPMVHRPQTFIFEDLRDVDGSNIQNVLIEGQDGFYYRAEYDMLLTDQGWKIRGVRVFKAEGVGA